MRARGGAGGGSTGDSEPARDRLSRSPAAEGGRYTCVHAPAATGHPPANASSGSGDQQLSDSQQPTTTVTKPMNSANTMYTSAFPSCLRMPSGCRLRQRELMSVGSPRVRQSRYPRPLEYWLNLLTPPTPAGGAVECGTPGGTCAPPCTPP